MDEDPEILKVEEAVAKYTTGPASGQEEATMLSLVNSAQNGISVSAFFDLCEMSSISKDELAGLLGVSSKTMMRYQKSNKKLNVQHSEHILKLLALYQKGLFVFGSLESFNRWLRKPAHGLYGKIPFTYMQTSGGIDLISEELGRIEHGVFA